MFREVLRLEDYQKAANLNLKFKLGLTAASASAMTFRDFSRSRLS